ncbi:hypothetical protein AB996_1039 [Lactococcus cremoris]|uniref:Uncharacterized protein n=1 Tax=Lactococcus lactis subsp. cremoris TaxID=1359 RepID=A0A161W2Z4_LACLC|nr:hypothetical protein [Lactococcus cremoris]KZK07010.1 hypothetical protein AB996_1039 [Lactococcus cremoris]
MNFTMTRASIRRNSFKKKVSVLLVSSVFISGTVFASVQVFVSGGWNTNYVERFNPTIGQATGYDNAKINQRHYSWVKVRKSATAFSNTVSANKIAQAKAIGAWNAGYSGWFVKL